ncbi:hypothetical protein [Ectobacillus ponti]|uniref:Uncharacterized protein n=1 Tax=Ectobacillus ponti TaxID=2961894 RepID=A0AA42BPB2_9BACI|nr:hypothetical protein [Ectobacillus ponti]MCP8968577.1 hypothetical protein [Ectobacillus ponti]
MNEDFEKFHKLQEQHKTVYLGSKQGQRQRAYDNAKDNARGGIDSAPGLEGREHGL